MLALTTEAYRGFGGIATYGRDLFDALALIPEVERVVCVPRQAGSGSDRLPAKLDERSPPASIAGYAWTALAAARGLCPTLVLCGHINLLPVADLIRRATGTPILLMAYGIEVWRDRGWLRYQALRHVERVLAISRHTRARLLEWAPVEPHRVGILCNAIHLDRYAPGPRPADLVARYGLEGRRVLLTVSRLAASEAYKGHDHIIRVLARLRERHPDAIYLIAGDGDDRGRLESLARSYGVQAHVVFAGRIAEDELVRHYHLADAFAMPSTGEGFGFVFLEAMACALPTLGGATDGGRDALVDGELGVLVDPRDPQALLDGLDQILRAPKSVPTGLSRFAFPVFTKSFAANIARTLHPDA